MTPADSSLRPQLDRRTAIKWMLTAAASVAIMDRAAADAATTPAQAAVGYGTDPELNKIYKAGDFWPLTFTASQRPPATARGDAISPADATSPAAPAVGVPDCIDEWISAPYPGHDKDRALILDGLVWIDAEAQKRFGNDFADLVAGQQRALCDDICYVPKAKPEFKTAALFFNKFRDLTSGGFYTTPEGMKDLGYVGNVPLATYDGPTPAALKHLGLA